MAAAGVIGLLAACFGTPSVSEHKTLLRCPDCPTLRVIRVVDGDTFESWDGMVQVFGIDTPDSADPCHRQAISSLRQLAGKVVRVKPGPNVSVSGEQLRYYVYTNAGDSIDEILIREGLARAGTGDGQHCQLLTRLEDQAQNNRAGCL
ncbi:MAG: thermonuclease family protein [Dehalococcoidia bacterium]|nr:thermonuclease family protein [Dehalococcoidia bacterium]